MLQKDRFTIDTAKLKSLIFPAEYGSFNQMCYHIVLFDNMPCSVENRDTLKIKSVNKHIKKQINELAEYKCHKPVGKRDEHQYIYGLKDYFRELMKKELSSGKYAKYDSLTLLLKNLINMIYRKDGIGKHVKVRDFIISELNFIGGYYDADCIQNMDYADMVITKLEENIYKKIDYYMTSLKNVKGLSIYKAGTMGRMPLNKTLDGIYKQIREQEKRKMKEYRKLSKSEKYKIQAEQIRNNAEIREGAE